MEEIFELEQQCLMQIRFSVSSRQVQELQHVEVFEDAQSLGSICRIGAETLAG
jgi:hypothetical protein